MTQVTTMKFQGPTFSLEMPTHWVVTANAQFQAVFMAPADESGVHANMTISMRPVQPNVTAQAVAEEALTFQKQAHPDLGITEETDFTQQGGLGILRRFHWVHQESQITIVQAQWFIIYQDILYVLTTTSSGNTEYEDAFNRMLSSFRLSQ